MANDPQNLTETGVRVHFVTPDTSSPDGYYALGNFGTHLPPRKDEVVTLDASFGSDPQRFRVVEVIHHMPPLGLPGHVINDVTVVVAQICTAADLERIIATLCLRPPAETRPDNEESRS